MTTEQVLDLVGIGFGPAGVALAAALDDLDEGRSLALRQRVAFLERGAGPGWQTGLLFRNADIQHHFLRDLATPRDPRSRYSFANYLKEHDRLFEFGSLVYGAGGGAVSRIEWSDYVAWAARLLDDYVRYETPVSSVSLERPRDGETLLRVETDGGAFMTRSVAYCAGQPLNIPRPFRAHLGDKVFHGTQFLKKIGAIDACAPLRVCVVGAGQTACEVTLHLHTQFPNSKITCLQRSLGFHHGNHSPFIQRMFHPRESDAFFQLPSEGRQSVLAEVSRANYAAADREALSALNRSLYEDALLGQERMRMVPGHEITTVERRDDGVYVLRAASRHDHGTVEIEADVVVLCTGFADRPLPEVLEPLREHLSLMDSGEPLVGYDYDLTLAVDEGVSVFIPGAGEPSHGLGSSSSFSMIAVKAGRVTRALEASGLLSARPDASRLRDCDYIEDLAAAV